MLNYLEHWELITNPFSNYCNDEVYFRSSSFDEAKSRCKFSVNNNNSFLLLGHSGSGKTYFLNKLINEQISNNDQYFYIQAGNFTAFDLLSSICCELQIEVSSWYKMDVVKAIQNRLLYYEDELNIKCTIVVDDADMLSKKVLNELSLLNNFGVNSSKHLNLILSGSQALRSKLQNPELIWLRHEMLLNATLEPLDRLETKHYIDSCFDAVDFDADGIILEDGLDVVYKYSSGNYRLINNIMTCCLIVCAIEDSHAITKDIVLKAKDETLI